MASTVVRDQFGQIVSGAANPRGRKPGIGVSKIARLVDLALKEGAILNISLPSSAQGPVSDLFRGTQVRL